MTNETSETTVEVNEPSEMIVEVMELGERRSYRQLVVLLLLVVVFTFVSLRWKTGVGCFVFLSLTLFIVRFRSPPGWRRLLTAIWMILAIALAVGIPLYRWLNTPDMTITNNVLLRFLIGVTWSRVFWSAVAGLLAGISVIGVPLLAVMYVSSEWLLAMRETFGVTRGQALRLLFTVMFNMNPPYFIIEDGEIILTKPAGVLELFGGPGVAVVKPYNAVVFEWGGNVTRIEGPGVFLTMLFEFPKHIIDLRPQWESFPVEEVLTKDKVPLHIKCGLGYRIESREQTAERGEDPREVVEGRRFPGIISGEYPVYKRTIFKAAYGPAGDWKFTTKGATITQLRKVVAEFELRDIYRFDEQSKEFILAEIGRRTKEEVAKIVHYWGVKVGTVNIDTIEVSEAVRGQVWGMWGAEYLRRKTEIEAEAKKRTIVAEAEARKTARLQEAEGEETALLKIASGERAAMVEKAKGEKQAMMVRAKGERQASLERAEGEREVLVTRGEGQAEALARIERIKARAVEEMVNQLLRGLRDIEGRDIKPEVVERFVWIVERLSSSLIADDLTAVRYIEALERIAESETAKMLYIGEDQRFLRLRRGSTETEEA